MHRFQNIPGWPSEKEHLLGSFSAGRNSHAQLFTGPDGGGALPLALAYAGLLLCEQPGPDGACGTCTACIQTAKGTHPDLHCVFPVVKSGASGTSEEFLPVWRETAEQFPFLSYGRWLQQAGFDQKQALIAVSESERILKVAALRSFSGGARVILLWMPEKMNVNAANKLLKILEEPERGTYFILVSHQPEQLLMTIRSRCQILATGPLEINELSTWLQQQGHSAEAAHQAAVLARGIPGDALEILDAADHLVAHAENAVAWFRHAFRGEWATLVGWADAMGAEGRENIKAFLAFLSDFTGRLIPVKYPGSGIDFPTLLQVAGFKPDGLAAQLTPEKATGLLREIDRATADIERNVQPKVVLFDLSFQAHQILRKKG
jgi:DNA polymerase-3 subunit delta'